jgi:hypothetical protein
VHHRHRGLLPQALVSGKKNIQRYLDTTRYVTVHLLKKNVGIIHKNMPTLATCSRIF